MHIDFIFVGGLLFVIYAFFHFVEKNAFSMNVLWSILFGITLCFFSCRIQSKESELDSLEKSILDSSKEVKVSHE